MNTDRKFNGHFYWALSCVALVLIVTLAEQVNAGPDDDAMMGRPTFGQSGQIFVVRFSPESQRIDINFTGNQVATIDPDDITVLGHVFPFSGKPRELNVIWFDNHYQIQDRVGPSDHVDIEVKDRKSSKSERFHFNGPHPDLDGKKSGQHP